jgi:phosphatidylglycerophosphate synthase
MRVPMPVRLRFLATGLLLIGLTFAGARVLAAIFGLSLLFPAVTILVLAAKLVLALNVLDAGHSHPRLGPANIVTLVRAALVSLLAALIREAPWESLAWLAMAVGTAVALLDGIDGTLARRSGLSSVFGARFDMETDAFFVLVLSVLVWSHGKAGVWVLMAGGLRYGFVAAGAVLRWMRAPLAPSPRGRLMAVVQMVGLLVAMGPVVPAPFSGWVAGATLAGLCWSFGVDVGRLWRGRVLPPATVR